MLAAREFVRQGIRADGIDRSSCWSPDCWLLLLQGAAPASAERRVALVIGNSNYAHVAKLANPESDARAVAQTLKGAWFPGSQRLPSINPQTSLRTAVQRFSREAQTAEMALVFYAGHGMEFGGNNYLIPIDAQIKTDVDVEFETLSLDLVMRSIETGRPLAGRDPRRLPRQSVREADERDARGDPQRGPRPRSRRSSGRYAGGLCGKGGLDGRGWHPAPTARSPPLCCRHMATPSLDIRLMFGRVRDTVADLTRRQQEPFVYGSVGGREIYLQAPVQHGGSRQQVRRRRHSIRARSSFPTGSSVRNSDSPAVIRSYLERYPNGTFAPLARARLQELEAKRLAALPAGTAGAARGRA